ncbi:hypothetical protein K431DRAFT_285218 [Polychaeton citri CBS 116435]|uniref:DNA replication regulator SLD2 n=1 Tax=Polychaeton citri CBS 116435 TaxID=1314669 RepID=A0A9P4Q7F9_9PEZI|nr:hypothetical protein K431DRAFT_285218 [Polychaeton citri CBS 116435]
MDVETLRAELKSWEKTYLATNGHKPGKEDIRADAAISAKYKQYDQLRRPANTLSTNSTPRKRSIQYAGNVTPSRQRVLKERSANSIPIATPQRKTKHASDPPLPGLIPPSHEPDQPTPAFIRCALGPTPQKDGQVLGIFDMLPTATPTYRLETPSKRNSRAMDVSATPTKTFSPPTSTRDQLSRTPMSSGKRFYLDAFAGTPQKRKRDDEDEGTPSAATKPFATPAFLRRSFPLAPVDEVAGQDAEKASQPLPFKKRGLVRSLSSLIQGLKRQEEKKMDDDWDIMNELEAEGEGTSAEAEELTTTLVPDSQTAEGNFLHRLDNAEDSDSDQEQGTEVKRKPWKKKGLKRQTRRVIMRPVLHKAAKASEPADHSESEEEGDNCDKTRLFEETQFIQNPTAKQDGMSAVTSKSRSDGANYRTTRAANDRMLDSQEPSREELAKPIIQPKGGKVGGDEVKKVVRKISATAHANFRALKIKNKNSKGKGRGSGRFGRR